MNKYFLIGFALMLLGLNIGLRAGDWWGPKKVKIVKVKAKPPKPIVKVVKVEVPAPPVACIEPKPKKWAKRSVSSIGKPRKAAPTAAIPAPVVPAAAPAVSTWTPVVPTGTEIPEGGVISVDRRISTDLVDQTLKVGSEGAGTSLNAPVIKSIQTEE